MMEFKMEVIKIVNDKEVERYEKTINIKEYNLINNSKFINGVEAHCRYSGNTQTLTLDNIKIIRNFTEIKQKSLLDNYKINWNF